MESPPRYPPAGSRERCVCKGGGTNPCDVGLDLSGSWQQGHSATYNAPSRIQVVCKGFSPPPVGKGASRRPATAHRPERLSQWHVPLGAQAPLTWVGAGGGRRRRLLAWILT